MTLRDWAAKRNNHVHINAMIGDQYQQKAVEALPEPTYTYQSLEQELYHKGHGGWMQQRKLGNNTWLVRQDERIAVKLHQTYILTYTPDNRIILNSGGWETVTTKDRMNKMLGWGTITSIHGDWHVSVRFWIPSDSYGRGRFVEALVPFWSGMALNARTHEVADHPDAQFVDINQSLVMREASDLSRLLSVHCRMLEEKIEDKSLTNDDLKSALRILDRYRDEQSGIKQRMTSLESSMSWAMSRLEDVLEQGMKLHAAQREVSDRLMARKDAL
jgi:hypothetical protein